MGGGSHGKPYEIPDWRIYKVEDVPELARTQRMLAQKGLKDPWLRNEVWRYAPEFGTRRSRMMTFFFRGFKWGFAAFVATIALEKALDQLNPPSHHHGDQHH